MFGVSWTSCDPTPMPVLEIHGTNDNVTLWGGDYNDTYWGPYPGIEEVIDFWVGENDCINNEDIVLQSINTIKHRYFDCNDNAEVWLYEVAGGGHDWPGYSSQEIWNFFSSFIGLTGDVNEDSLINILDVILVINLILESEFNLTADINNDGSINVLDVVQLVSIILNN